MSLTKPREMTEENLTAHQTNARQSAGPVTPQGRANSAAANLRHGLYSETRNEVLLALGEQPQDHERLMDSLRQDLQPREGLEHHLVNQMGETLWGMQRAQRMREGLAMRRIQSKSLGEQMTATLHASKAIEILEPFERLQSALSRRDNGPTAEEIDDFARSRKGDSSAEAKEFICLLKSLKEPMEKPERAAARRQARAQLARLMQGHESAAWTLSRQASRVNSPENLAALMVPGESDALLLQRMEDSHLRRLWRLTNTLMKVRERGSTQKDVKNEDRSGNVYENKGSSDKMSEQMPDISAASSVYLQKKAAL